MALTPQSNTTIEKIAEVVRTHEEFVICGHVSPDGDCVGSQLALWHALRSLGKQATCLLARDEPLPESIAFMPGAELMVPAAAYGGSPQVFVGVDVPSRERIGADACVVLDRCATSITIDHHASETTMCEHVLVDPDSASASLLVWELVKELNEKPPIECVSCAFAGLVSDTGGFRYQNSDPIAFARAAELVSMGADPAYVSSKLFQSRTLASLALERVALERMLIGGGGAWALSFVTVADLKCHGAVKSDVEPLVDVLRSVGGLRVACMLREQDGVVRGSLRAKDDTDVSALARELGGGGHRAAAGLTLRMPLDDAVELMQGRLDALTGQGNEAR